MEQKGGGRMTECPKCKGYGIIGDAVPDILRGRGHIFSSIECPQCNGTGEVPMTNEEYLKSCTTEQLAEWMALRLNPGILLALRMKYHCTDINAVREWLKEKHD